MRMDDAREILEAAQVEPTSYFTDGDRHEALCIVSAGATRQVFLRECGSRHEERTFASEDDACVWFLKRLFQLSRLR